MQIWKFPKVKLGILIITVGLPDWAKTGILLGKPGHVQPNDNLFAALEEALDANNTLYIKHSRVVSYCYV